jgi:hypothetical protein
MKVRDMVVRRRRWLGAFGIAALATISVVVVSPAAAYASEICPIIDVSGPCDEAPPISRTVDIDIEAEAWGLSPESAFYSAEADAEQQCFALAAAEGGVITRATPLYGRSTYQGGLWKAMARVHCHYVVR